MIDTIFNFNAKRPLANEKRSLSLLILLKLLLFFFFLNTLQSHYCKKFNTVNTIADENKAKTGEI